MVYVIYRKDGTRIDGYLWRVSNAEDSLEARQMIADAHNQDVEDLGWDTLAALQRHIDIRKVKTAS